MPNWGREGETWRVQPEDAVPWRTDVYGLVCRQTDNTRLHNWCGKGAVAGYTTRGGEFHPFCEEHLRGQRMWIEDFAVVSWRLSR